jgi:hypothetical protein
LAGKTIQTSGLASVIMSYLSNRDRQRLNLLNKRFYSIVFPSIAAQVPHFEPKLWDDWLQWGSGKKSIIVKRGLNVKIGKDVGTYYGEWKQTLKTKKIIVNGRGALECSDKWIFGYI